MSIVRVRDKFQIVIPENLRELLGVQIGDTLEATAEKGALVLKPKTAVAGDRDEYSAIDRRRIDAQLEKSLAEHKRGQSYGPFETHEDLTKFLHEQVTKSGTRTKRNPRRRAR